MYNKKIGIFGSKEENLSITRKIISKRYLASICEVIGLQRYESKNSKDWEALKIVIFGIFSQ